MSRTRIIVFAKAPVPGRVKTRLIPALGEEGAAKLARAMLLSTLGEAQAAAVGRPELCADPDPADPAWERLVPAGFWLSAQGDGELGERLARAVKRGLRRDNAVVLIGTDCPALDRQKLRRIANELRNADAVIYPAIDGGYVALGLRQYDRSIFENIAWSGSMVARHTIERIEALGWRLHVGGTFRDVDTPEDLDEMRLVVPPTD